MPTPNPAAHAFLGGLQYLEIPNADIAYYRFGNNETGRPALMLVNGLNSVMGGWPLRLLRALAEEQEVVIFDNRGQGLSVVSRGFYARPEQVRRKDRLAHDSGAEYSMCSKRPGPSFSLPHRTPTPPRR